MHAAKSTSHFAKFPTGIAGFDDLSVGGLPLNRITLCLGGPGCGKTVFALQALSNTARRGSPGIFVAFEEPPAQLLENTACFGWDLAKLKNRKLEFVEARLSPEDIRSGQFDLSGLLATLTALGRKRKARHIVFDGVDVLLDLLNDPAAELRELHRLRDWIIEGGWTATITTRTDEHERSQSNHYGFLQFMADCVIRFRHFSCEGTALRCLQILKYRGAQCHTGEVPMEIYEDGMRTAHVAPLELDYTTSRERLKSDIPELDRMLGGGLIRGHCALLTGQPGTAKTTLCSAFAHAACRRRERVLFVSFDEPADQIVKNQASVSFDLGTHVKNGRLKFHSVRSEGASAEFHFLRIQSLLGTHKPALLIIDPFSALLKAGGLLQATQVVVRMLGVAKAAGITVLMTALTENTDGMHDPLSAGLKISTIADTWIHLTYMVRDGERNRAIDVIKSRGTNHSNQIRELLIDDYGVRLADVYTAGGEVLMGTARYEREANEARKRLDEQHEAERRSNEFRRFELDARSRIRAIEEELRLRGVELTRATEDLHSQEASTADLRKGIRSRRGGNDRAKSRSNKKSTKRKGRRT